MSETISQLPAGTGISGALGDVVPVTQGTTGPGTGITRKLSLGQILSATEVLFAGDPQWAGGVQANGVANDSSAWSAVLAQAANTGAIVVAPVGVSIANLTIPSNVTVVGANVQSYGASAVGEQSYTYVGTGTANSTGLGTVIKPSSGTAVIMQSFSNLYDVQVVGASNAICIDATAGRATIHNVDCSSGLHGVSCGNAVDGSNIRFCHFHHLTGNGIDSPYGCSILSNQFNSVVRAVSCVAGSNYNNISGNRAAFCSGNSYYFDGTSAGCFYNTVSNNISDRSTLAGIWCNVCINTLISGNGVFRSGRGGGANQNDAHFYIAGSTGTLITGNVTSVWGDDAPLAIGYNSPYYAVYDGGGNNVTGSVNTCQITNNTLVFHQATSTTPGTPTPINSSSYFNLSGNLNVVYWSAGRTV